MIQPLALSIPMRFFASVTKDGQPICMMRHQYPVIPAIKLAIFGVASARGTAAIGMIRVPLTTSTMLKPN